ncbi:hypothetical protein HNP46_005004 [Pseudomonas nitritireducens]|uniref:Uncharacterized protein n=1 Tax=Pseudomonas nitroreducens TaxID=46680 RepID=A0A7W7KNJ2_PSENT|nr:hypothetical protein [Pseudomonas nitritireducens]MBB4866099.1 hypothetical protein [Pseudomonas nitritireducens]
MIETIPMWKMLMETKGKAAGLTVLVLLPVLIVAGAGMFLDGLRSGQKHQAVMGFIGLIFFGACTLVFAPAKKYIPGKTFKFYRDKRLTTQSAINYGYGLVTLIVAAYWVLAPGHTGTAVVFWLLGFLGLYFYSKSLKFHADIDFSANEYLATALGFAVGEKILVSYQNFYLDEIEAGSNAFAATATKLIVASFDGVSWKKLSRDLDQVSHIGIIGDEDQRYFVKLQFSDGACVLLCVGLYEKITSSPTLVIRKLLETIDASLLGGSGATQAAPRRRVVASSEVPVATLQASAPETTPVSPVPMRNIELSSEAFTAIRDAEEITPGRQLEI